MAKLARRSSRRTHKIPMNNDYVWTFNETALGPGVNGPFSLEYHVPGQKLIVDPAILVGSRLWLVAKNDGECFLYAALTPSTIESYREGKYKDDFLLTAEEFSSVRFLPRRESREPWKLNSFPANEEIRECTMEEKLLFHELIERNRRVNFAPPARIIIESVPKTGFSDMEHAVPDQFMSVLRTVSLGDVSVTKSFSESISALGGVAFAILKSIRPDFSESEVMKLIAALDFVKTMGKFSETSREEMIKTLASLPPVVDTFLEEIDPDKISPRTFVAAVPAHPSEWIDKINDAEEAHENILRDMALRLKEMGFKIYKSRSFDIFAEKSGARLLLEIKSANGFNAVAQGEKGVIQLLRYSTALSVERFTGTKFLLLLQDSNQPAVQRYLSEISSRAGSELWLYDSEKEWPNRVSGINSEVFSNL